MRSVVFAGAIFRSGARGRLCEHPWHKPRLAVSERPDDPAVADGAVNHSHPRHSVVDVLEGDPAGCPAVVLTDWTHAPGYTVNLVAANGCVIASATARTWSGYSATAGQPVSLPTSESATRVYFLDGDSTLRFLGLDGSIGVAAQLPGSSNSKVAFSVSPDNTRLAFSVMSWGSDERHFTEESYVEDLGTGADRTELFTLTGGNVAEEPIGWINGDIVFGLLLSANQYGAGPTPPTAEEGAGLDYIPVTERPQESAQTFRLVRERMLDGIKGHRRFHRPDGSMIELEVTGWAVRSSTGPDLGLWIASEVQEAEDANEQEEVVASAPRSHAGSELDGAQLTLDDHWRIAHISTNAGVILGRPPAELLGRSIIEFTHSRDLAALLLGFARATTDARTDVRIRLCQVHGWRTIRVMITVLEGDGTMPFSLIVAPAGELEAPDSSGANQLAGHLRRIAAQIEAAGILAPLMQTAAALGVPATAELSPRQWEIASRLVQGDRVATIAAEMYLSQSTVRNHLSAIFQKFGVHSQPELLALWRDSTQGKTANG